MGTHAGDVVRGILVRPRDTLLPGALLALEPHGRVPEREYSLEDHVTDLGVGTQATVETRTIHGDPATELVTASADADRLVLGAHRGGAMADLVLGSVGRECVRFSRFPIVVITPKAARHLTLAQVPPTGSRFGAHVARFERQRRVMIDYPWQMSVGVFPVDWSSQGDEWIHRFTQAMASRSSTSVTGHRYDGTTAPFICVTLSQADTTRDTVVLLAVTTEAVFVLRDVS